MSNLNNLNIKFQDFSKCDYSKHWSWSNFFRHIFVCNEILELNASAKIIELGGATSFYQHYLNNNFNKDYSIMPYDIIEKEGVVKCDITKKLPIQDNTVDCVIFTEVIEHLKDRLQALSVLKEIKRILKKDGKMILSSPTPTESGDLVWSESHEIEFTFLELEKMVSEYFKIRKTMSWSQTERQYLDFIAANTTAKDIYTKLSRRLPDGMIQAFISLLAPYDCARQTIMMCKPIKEFKETKNE